jgi:dual specificity tyrosine-phosphorylation-regulated kinase 2/3/4
MSGMEAFNQYGPYLNAYEREEVKKFEIVYFLNPNIKRKQIIMPMSTSDPEEQEDGSGNYGYDGEDGEYLFEAHDHINYRYEILKKLGKGAFGVVLRCVDHVTNE